jgi:hypothetical protein
MKGDMKGGSTTKLNTTEKIKSKGYVLGTTLKFQDQFEMSKMKSPDGRNPGGKSVADKRLP